MLVFIRNSWVVLHCGCIILYFCQQCIKVPFAPYCYQHLVLPIFVILRVSDGWVDIPYLVLFSIFLIINEFFFYVPMARCFLLLFFADWVVFLIEMYQFFIYSEYTSMSFVRYRHYKTLFIHPVAYIFILLEELRKLSF